eukprot:11655484-Alexandrium_andersonii.AAC.1
MRLRGTFLISSQYRSGSCCIGCLRSAQSLDKGGAPMCKPGKAGQHWGGSPNTVPSDRAVGRLH